MRRIRWAPAAADNLEAISRYLQKYRPELRRSTIRRLYASATSLKASPFRGRIGRKPGTGELVLAPLPYIIVYGLEPSVTHIFRVIHTSRDWPEGTL